MKKPIHGKSPQQFGSSWLNQESPNVDPFGYHFVPLVYYFDPPGYHFDLLGYLYPRGIGYHFGLLG